MCPKPHPYSLIWFRHLALSLGLGHYGSSWSTHLYDPILKCSLPFPGQIITLFTHMACKIHMFCYNSTSLYLGSPCKGHRICTAGKRNACRNHPCTSVFLKLNKDLELTITDINTLILNSVPQKIGAHLCRCFGGALRPILNSWYSCIG